MFEIPNHKAFIQQIIDEKVKKHDEMLWEHSYGNKSRNCSNWNIMHSK